MFAQVVQAMADIGMGQQENAEVQQAIAAILCLGNIEFGEAPDDQASVSDPNMMQLAIDFLGCADLEQALDFYVGGLGFDVVQRSDFDDVPDVNRVIGLDAIAARMAMLKAPNA